MSALNPETAVDAKLYATWMKRCVIGAVAALSLTVLLAFAVIFIEPDKRYFAQTESGRIVPIVSFGEPIQTNEAITGWVVQAVTETMTFGFHDWRLRLGSAMRYFTEDGRRSFNRAIESAGLLDRVRENRQIISSAPRAMPVIVQEGPNPLTGQYQWIVQVPINMTTEAGAVKSSSRFRVTLAVVRVSTLEKAQGLGIQQWVTEPI